MEDYGEALPYLAGGALGFVLVLGLYFGMGSKNDVSGSESSTSSGSKFPAGPLTVFFGSQTGTAEGYARTIMEEAREKGFDAQMCDLTDFNADELKDAKLAIFLMATYGEGEPTDNAADFYSWMQNKDGDIEDGFLDGLKFTVFGLGNTQYEHYNRMGKLTDKHIETLGGERVFELGEGDDDGTLEDDFEAWVERLWPKLVKTFHPDPEKILGARARSVSIGGHTTKKVTLQFKSEVVSASQGKLTPPPSQINSSTKHFFTSPSVTVQTNKELRNVKKGSDIGSTRHVELDLTGSKLSYVTADNLGILPENDDELVNALAASQGFNLDATIVIAASPGATTPFKHMFPTPCTVRDVLTKYLDIHGLCRHAIAAHILAYVKDDSEREWLSNLLDKANKAEYKADIEDGGLCIGELISANGPLSSARIPLDDLMHIVPFLQPRLYTISSSSSTFPTSVHITVSVTENDVTSKVFNKGKPRKFTGVCSGFLRNLKPSVSKCGIFVRPSTFRLPPSLGTPIILIGPGTGLAPMRALLQEREFQGKKTKTSAGRNTLFFGCRRRDEDYIYKDELEAYEKSGTITKLHTAFSREGGNKVYVQHLLAKDENATQIITDLDAGGYIYVCGATNMGTDVMEAFVVMFMEKYHIGRPQAVEEIKKLQKKGRYVQELWTA